MKVITLLFLLATGAGVAATAGFAMAATIYRSGDFDRANTEMTSCPGDVLVKRHPKLYYIMGNTSDGASFSGSWSSGAKDFIWMIVAKPTSPKSSHIVLRNYTAKPEELDEVWREIEECGKKK